VGAIALADADLQRFLLPPASPSHYLTGGGGGTVTVGTVTVTETTGVDTVTAGGGGGIVGAGAAGTDGTIWVTEFVVGLTVETPGADCAEAVGALPEGAVPEEPLSDGRSLVGVPRSAPFLETAECRWRKAAALTAAEVD